MSDATWGPGLRGGCRGCGGRAREDASSGTAGPAPGRAGPRGPRAGRAARGCAVYSGDGRWGEARAEQRSTCRIPSYAYSRINYNAPLPI